MVRQAHHDTRPMSKISLQYARSLTDSIDTKHCADTAAELDILADVFAQDDVASFLDMPRVSSADKVALIEKALTGKASAELTNLATILVKHRRQKEMGAIADDFKKIAASKSGDLTAEIETAVKMSNMQLEQLTASLAKMTGKNIRTEVTENKSLIGGVKIMIDGDVIDLSLAGKAAKLRQAVAA